MSNKIMIVGNSHISAIRKAKKFEPLSTQCLENIDTYKLAVKKREVGPNQIKFQDFLDICKELSPEDTVLSIIGGNVYNMLGLAQHDHPFHLIGSTKKNNLKDSQLLTHALVKEVFEEMIEGNFLSKLRELRQQTNAKILHLSCPPPKEDNKFLEENLSGRLKERNLIDNGFSAPELRLELWKLQCEISKKKLEEIGVRFVKFPSFAINAYGYLKKEFYASDATHANQKYGAKLLANLQDIIALK